MKIGVFDSGLGGLAILKSIVKELPRYDYIYLGDNARVPYGGRSAEILYRFTREAVDFLFRQDCQLVILACNSATANALKKLQHEYLPKVYPNRKILGVIKPTIEYLSENHKSRVGILGTHATVDSKAYIREIVKILPQSEIRQEACPLLVPLIEENEADSPAMDLFLDKYLAPFYHEPPEVLILACTHYGLVKKQIQAKLPQTRVIDQGELVAHKLALYLLKHEIVRNRLSTGGERVYYVTDLNDRFQQIAEMFLGESLTIQKITL